MGRVESGRKEAAPGPLGRLHAVIMAGGSGTRFWPLSRRSCPKQFLPLGGAKSLLRETFERLEPLVSAERVWVVSGEAHVKRVREEVPEMPAGNILGEPAGRNTAPCIGLAAHRVIRRDPDAEVLVCPADHILRPAEAFASTVEAAVRLLQAIDRPDEPATVTLGIIPRYPATGFGYIERGRSLAPPESGGAGAFEARSFKEKPGEETARRFLESGRFYWNSGIFLWRARGVLALLEKHLPALSEGLRAIDSKAGARRLKAALAASFPELPSISIDFGVLEHATNVAVIAAGFEWDDVGSWRAVERYAPRDDAGNSVMGRHVGIDTKGCILVGSKRILGTIGVEGLVVVETPDAVLVCSRDATERIKEIVERFQTLGWTEYL